MKANQGSERRGQEKSMPRNLRRKSKRESYVLPKELEAKQRRNTSKANTDYASDIEKKAKKDKSAREVRSRQECEDKI